LVQRPEDWKWSSVLDYTGTVLAPARAGCPIPVDRISLPPIRAPKYERCKTNRSSKPAEQGTEEKPQSV